MWTPRKSLWLAVWCYTYGNVVEARHNIKKRYVTCFQFQTLFQLHMSVNKVTMLVNTSDAGYMCMSNQQERKRYTLLLTHFVWCNMATRKLFITWEANVLLYSNALKHWSAQQAGVDDIMFLWNVAICSTILYLLLKTGAPQLEFLRQLL
jgi:hypothetical protein